MAANTAAAPAEIPSSGPKQAGIVLATLIVVSAVANLPLAMANVALPAIGKSFDASQTQSEPGGGRLLAGSGDVGAVAGRVGRPLWPQAVVAPRRDTGDPRGLDRRLCPVD